MDDYEPVYRKPRLTGAKAAIEKTEKRNLDNVDALNLGKLIELIDQHLKDAVERGSYGIQYKIPNYVGMSIYDPEELLPHLAKYLEKEGGYKCDQFPPDVIHIKWDHLKKKKNENDPPPAKIQDIQPVKHPDAFANKSTTTKQPAKKTVVEPVKIANAKKAKTPPKKTTKKTKKAPKKIITI